MPNEDRTGPRERSRYSSKPMGGQRKGICEDIIEKDVESISEKIINKIMRKNEH